MNTQASIGATAPNFTLIDQNGKKQTLSDYRGQKVALYFYPKNNTPGCTAQACSLRDQFEELNSAEISILGISFDGTSSHKEFSAKHGLTYPLLADTDHVVARLYNAVRNFIFFKIPKRVTYLIDEQGIIIDIIQDIDTNNHAEQIITRFKNIKDKK